MRACGSEWMGSARAAAAVGSGAPPAASGLNAERDSLSQTMKSCAMYKITYVARKKQVRTYSF